MGSTLFFPVPRHSDVTEGVEREGALIEDHWETDVMMSILEHEYRSKIEIS